MSDMKTIESRDAMKSYLGQGKTLTMRQDDKTIDHPIAFGYIFNAVESFMSRSLSLASFASFTSL